MRVRWLCGGRVFDGVLRESGVEYDLEDATAASLIASGFAEAVTAPVLAPAKPALSGFLRRTADTAEEE